MWILETLTLVIALIWNALKPYSLNNQKGQIIFNYQYSWILNWHITSMLLLSPQTASIIWTIVLAPSSKKAKWTLLTFISVLQQNLRFFAISENGKFDASMTNAWHLCTSSKCKNNLIERKYPTNKRKYVCRSQVDNMVHGAKNARLH